MDFSAEKFKKEEVKKIQDDFREYPDLKPRLSFLFPLSEERQNALKIIKNGEIADIKEVEKLLNSDDFVEKRAGFFILGNCRYANSVINKDILNLSKKINTEKDFYRNWSHEDEENENLAMKIEMNMLVAAQKEKSMTTIENLFKKGSVFEKKAIIEALYLGGMGGETTQRFLEKMIAGEGFYACIAIANLDIFGEEFLPLLDKLAADKDASINSEALKTRLRILVMSKNDISTNIIEEMANHSDIDVRLSLVKTLARFGKKYKKFLKYVADTNSDLSIRNQAEVALKSPKPREWLLFSRKPFLATQFSKELLGDLNEVNKLANEFFKKYGSQFIGFIVVGSVHKGYFDKQQGSDIDLIVIARNSTIRDDLLKKKLEGDLPVNICLPVLNDSIVVDDRLEIKKGEAGNLFRGLFFGNKASLIKVQKKSLETVNKETWDDIRSEIMHNELMLSTMAHRYDYDTHNTDFEKIKQIVSLLRIPPSLERMREIFNKK